MDRFEVARSPGSVATLWTRNDEVRVSYRDPQPLSPTEVRVRVDLALLGSIAVPPGRDHTSLGDDFVGHIVGCGAEVPASRLGERVLGIVRGWSAATEIVLPGLVAYPCPDDLEDRHVVSVLSTGLLSCVVVDATTPTAGSVVVVLDAGSGVACLLGGMLRSLGATGLACHHAPQAPAVLRDLGFDHVFTGRTAPTPDALRAWTGGRLADLVVDCSRHEPRPWGEVGSILADSGAAVRCHHGDLGDWDRGRSRFLDLVPSLSSLYGRGGQDLFAVLDVMLPAVARRHAAGEIDVPIHRFALEDAQVAYDLWTSDELIGRVAIRMNEPQPVRRGHRLDPIG